MLMEDPKINENITNEMYDQQKFGRQTAPKSYAIYLLAKYRYSQEAFMIYRCILTKCTNLNWFWPEPNIRGEVVTSGNKIRLYTENIDW